MRDHGTRRLDPRAARALDLLSLAMIVPGLAALAYLAGRRAVPSSKPH